MSQNPIIKKGYKQTEIGVIPEDWDVVPLEDISDKRKQWSITGGPFGSNLKASDYTNVGVQIIQLQNIGDGYFDNENQIYTSKEKADELKSCNIYPGEIIISKMGDPVARACLIPSFQKRFVMSSDGIRLLINKDENIELYILNYINSPYFRNRAFAVSTGSTRLRIGLPELKGLLIVKPSKVEQSAIASILSDTDALIDNLNKLVEKKKAIKQGTMQELLTGKRRLPGFSGKWEARKLGDLAIFFKGKGLPKSSISESGKYKCIHYGELFTQYSEEIQIVKSYTDDSINLFYSRSNDVLMPTSDVTPNGLAKASAVKEDGVILGGDVMVIRTFEGKVNGTFLAYSIRFHKDQVMQLVSGSTVYHLYGSDMKKFEFKLPSTIEEQDGIVNILNEISEEIAQLEVKRDKLQKVKQGMMQQLLTGNIRVYGHQ